MTRSTQEILDFIEQSRRLPHTPQRESYVRWLVQQFELQCTATVIKKPQKRPIIHREHAHVNKYKHYEQT